MEGAASSPCPCRGPAFWNPLCDRPCSAACSPGAPPAEASAPQPGCERDGCLTGLPTPCLSLQQLPRRLFSASALTMTSPFKLARPPHHHQVQAETHLLRMHSSTPWKTAGRRVPSSCVHMTLPYEPGLQPNGSPAVTTPPVLAARTHAGHRVRSPWACSLFPERHTWVSLGS